MTENPYFSYAEAFERITTEGKNLPLGGIPSAKRKKPTEGSPVVLIMSPHPDDECIIGGFPPFV